MENQKLIKLRPSNRKMTPMFCQSSQCKLAGKSAQTPDSGNQAALEVVIQQQQITIDKLLVRIVKLEKHVIALEGGLASASHVTSV